MPTGAERGEDVKQKLPPQRKESVTHAVQGGKREGKIDKPVFGRGWFE